MVRIPPCRICYKAYMPMNFGRIDYAICEDCYNDIVKKNGGRSYYVNRSINAMRDTWGPTDPNNRMQKKYVKAMNRRYKFGIAFCIFVFFGFCIFFGRLYL